MGNNCNSDRKKERAPEALGPLTPTSVSTQPIEGQKPGTSAGLRKKTKEFMQDHYLNKFVQATFDAIIESGTDVSKGSLVIGGDGRYYNTIQIIIQRETRRRFWFNTRCFPVVAFILYIFYKQKQ